IGKTRP
ncbi:ATP-dependent zinc protease domain protein, partial [Chlamydia psittaci 08DC60]